MLAEPLKLEADKRKIKLKTNKITTFKYPSLNVEALPFLNNIEWLTLTRARILFILDKNPWIKKMSFKGVQCRIS